jgi:hypothetical protein
MTRSDQKWKLRRHKLGGRKGWLGGGADQAKWHRWVGARGDLHFISHCERWRREEQEIKATWVNQARVALRREEVGLTSWREEVGATCRRGRPLRNYSVVEIMRNTYVK